jgi:hypothetical protein
MKSRVLMLAAIFGLAGAAAHAGTILNDTATSQVQVEYFGPIGQSFTAIDDQLVSIGFKLGTLNQGFPNDPVTVDLYSGTGTGGTLLASDTLTLPASLDYTAFTNFDFSGTTLTVGGIYSAVVSIDGSSPHTGIGLSLTDTYSGGTAFSQNLGDAGCNPGACDLAFQVVGTSAAGAVPEPATWAMMILGFGAAGAALRQRRRTAAAA